MLFIRINVNNETNNTVVKERDKVDISVIYNIFPERKVKLNELGINIYDDSWIFVVVYQMFWEGDPWRIIRNTNNNIPFFRWRMSGVVHTGAESLQDRLRDMWTLLNNLGFSLCAAPPVCHVVAISDNRKKSEMEVSADLVYHCWILGIEFNKSLSSLIIRLANYSVTTSLIYEFLL